MAVPEFDDGRIRLGVTEWLIVFVAALGFAFDTYQLLMQPIIARPALAELLPANPATTSGFNAIAAWSGYIMWASAVSGGVFGLIGGYLTDYFGRRRVLVWSILLYALSASATAFSTSPMMLLVLRCLTFIGVCVEFVAAVAWLAELFPNPRQRETVLGYTQVFGSFGGIMVAGAYYVCVQFADHFPAIFDAHAPWRYTLISGVIPAIPLIIIRPFLPESPEWRRKAAQGTLRRPSFVELFRPRFRRTTIVAAVLFACTFGAAFGAIQLMPQIVPGLVPGLSEIPRLRKQIESPATSEQEKESFKQELRRLGKEQEGIVSKVQTYQEIGGLAGRFLLAWLAVRIVSRRNLLRIFQIPGLILIPLVFLFPARTNLELFKWGMFIAGLCTIAQMSFWGNYLPRVYPVYLRGTGESFAANVGGRMFGTSANLLATQLSVLLTAYLPGTPGPHRLAYAAAAVAFLVYGVGSIVCFWLPEPPVEELPD